LHQARAPHVAFVLPGTVLAEDFTERAHALLEHPDDLCAVVADVSPEPERASGDRRPKSPREPFALMIRRSAALAVGGFNTPAPIDLIAEMQARGYDMARLERVAASSNATTLHVELPPVPRPAAQRDLNATR
jgi:hypothetical protein